MACAGLPVAAPSLMNVRNMNSKEGQQDTRLVKFELTWRDYFVYYAHKYGEKLFFLRCVKGSSRKGASIVALQA